MNKLKLPITIIVACLILGISYYAVQVRKQKTIETQIFYDEDARQYKQIKLSECLDEAQSNYDDFINTNGKERSDGTLWVDKYTSDRANKDREVAMDACSIKYK